VAAADLDGDGDLDLVSANKLGNTLTVFFQTAPGVFDPVPSLTLDSPRAAAAPKFVTAADVDGDGDVDLVSMNPGRGAPGDGGNNKVTVFFQTRAGVFDSETLPLSDLPTIPTEQAVAAAVADLDGDGDVDIISANGSSANLTVFYGTHQP
jgi:FG-GAP-like repeat